MSDLILNVAIGNYGHTTPLKDGSVQSSMFRMEHTEVTPVTSIFRRMTRGLEFDVAEMALSTYLCARAHGKAFTGIPIFLTRAFYHDAIVVRKSSGIREPKDLEGRRVGVRSYTLTPGVWTRGILQSEYGVDLDAVTWVLSGDEHVAEFVAPANVVSSSSGDLMEMLQNGEIDAAIGVRAGASPELRPLFSDPAQADTDWSRKTGIYPISHMVVVKNSLLEQYPELAAELFRVFQKAKSPQTERLNAGEVSGPMDAELLAMSKIVRGDPLPYGLQSSLQTLNTFLDFNVSQRVIPHRWEPAELFPEATLTLG